MYQVEFNPITVTVEFKLREEITLSKWGSILRYFFQIYADYITKGEKKYIGHIKGAVFLNDNDYIKVSVFRESIPPQVDIKGEVKTSKVDVLVNSFVYGVDETITKRALEEVCSQVTKEFLIETSFKIHKSTHNH